LVSCTNPGTPVGGQAPSPFTVQAVAADGVTPVAGASVQFVCSPFVAFSACSGSTNCTVLTDQSGFASTYMTVLSSGVMTVTAKLPPATYPNAQQVQVTLLGTSSQLDLSLTSPSVWIAQGATVTLSILARVLSNGVPLNGRTLNHQITRGTGNLSHPTSASYLNGNASFKLLLSLLSSAE